MYKPTDKSQNSFLDFNQPLGLHMNPKNRWIKMADLVPWYKSNQSGDDCCNVGSGKDCERPVCERVQDLAELFADLKT
jgi:hypothetical protein